MTPCGLSSALAHLLLYVILGKENDARYHRWSRWPRPVGSMCRDPSPRVLGNTGPGAIRMWAAPHQLRVAPHPQISLFAAVLILTTRSTTSQLNRPRNEDRIDRATGIPDFFVNATLGHGWTHHFALRDPRESGRGRDGCGI